MTGEFRPGLAPPKTQEDHDALIKWARREEDHWAKECREPRGFQCNGITMLDVVEISPLEPKIGLLQWIRNAFRI